MLLGQCKVCLLSEEGCLKNMAVHSFIGIFPPFPVDVLEDVKIPNSMFTLENKI